jgi:hypothetical protein
LAHAFFDPSDPFWQPFHYPTAQDQTARIESIDQADGSSHEGFPRLVHDFLGQRVPLVCSLGDHLGGKGFWLSVGHLKQSGPGALLLRHSFSGAPGDGPAPGQSFQATTVAAVARGTAQINDYVAQLASGVAATGEHLPATHHPAADAGSNK